MLTIHTFCFNAFQENTYVLFNEQKEAIIVDPGCYLKQEQETLSNFIKDNGLAPKVLLNTHCHLDHVFGNNYVCELYGLTALIHPNEQIILDHLPEAAARWGVATDAFRGTVKYIHHNEIIEFGNDSFKVLATPGHSPGSVCFYNEAQAFLIGGDLIFMDGVGRTDLPGSKPQDLIQSIITQILPLPEAVVIYSGHGESTTWGREKAKNPYIKHLLK